MTSIVVGVDPGYRNLAIVVLRVDRTTKACELVNKMHIDVGPCQYQEDIIMKLWNVLVVRRPFECADFVVIEDQCLGRRHTTPNNQGIAWLLAGIALSQSKHAAISYMSSKKKFAEFKHIPLRHVISARKQKGERDRRAKIKTNAIYLATTLLSQHGVNPSSVFTTGCRPTWDHLADAAGLAFVLIKHL